MKDKDLLDRIKTSEELRKRGYRQKTCKACSGIGRAGRTMYPCLSCDGRGYRWVAPLMC
jgi:hypothetical protein